MSKDKRVYTVIDLKDLFNTKVYKSKAQIISDLNVNRNTLNKCINDKLVIKGCIVSETVLIPCNCKLFVK